MSRKISGSLQATPMLSENGFKPLQGFQTEYSRSSILNSKETSTFNLMRPCIVLVSLYLHILHVYTNLGTRQGSIWSPFLYSIYINELLNNLCQSQFGLKINKIPMCAPTQADGVVLLSLTKDGLNELNIHVSFTYAHKWRYRYNASKCAVLVQSKNIRQSRDI